MAVDMLLEITEKGSYSHLLIKAVLAKYNYLDARDRSFMKRLTEGTLERRIQIDYILNQFSSVPVSRMKPFIRNLLRISVYQLLFMDGVPHSAACNEAVKLAGKRGFGTLRGFVNGVLRNIGRNKDKISYPDKEKNTLLYLSVIYSMPEWLTEKFIREYGKEGAEKILKGLLDIHPVTVRLKESLPEEEKEKWQRELREKQVSVKGHPYLGYAFALENTEDITKLPGFREGSFLVQDVSSMLAGEAAGYKTGDFVIDVCAAPGGKALHAAEKLCGTGQVLARDLTEYKVSLIRDNIERMKLENILAEQWDACTADDRYIEKADVVLADLPCSGLGIMGKKRDIKYHVTPESLKELSALQREILSQAGQYVKPGGVLIYSTCTLNPEENQKNVEGFIENYPFEAESLTPFLPEELKEEGKDGMLQLLPGYHLTDGFFIARLKRKEK